MFGGVITNLESINFYISNKLENKSASEDVIDNILEDKANFQSQDHSKATYAKKIDKKGMSG